MSRVSMFTKVLGMTLGFVLVAGQWCQAQPPGRPGARGLAFGGFGQIDATFLLRSEQVQEELNLSDAQKEKVGQALEEARQVRREVFTRDIRDLSEEERAELRKKMQELNEQSAKKVKEILTDEQRKRLDEIALQVRGINALRDEQVAAKLKLTDDQKKKIRDLLAAQREMQRELFAGLRDLSREERRQKFQELRQKREEITKETEKAVLETLTSDQREQWNQMRGKPFELDRRTLFGRRFGRGGDRGGDRSNN